MKIAVIHYWWLVNRGGESVVTSILELYPEADLYMHVYDEKVVRDAIGSFHKGKIFNTFISKLPFSKKLYQLYLPFMPYALDNLDLSMYDLVISSESGPAKGVITNPNCIHISYVHSPMRYIWDMYHEYIGSKNILTRFFFKIISHRLRIWDRVSADYVDFFITNSKFISKRLKKFYKKETFRVIHPPVNTDAFDHNIDKGNFFLMLGELTKYKKPDMAIKAFNKLGLPLKVIGGGEMLDEIKDLANKNIEILGRQDFKIVKDALEKSRALIFPGIEDFGIVPVEALSAGTPVIAYGKGGILDTVENGATGILYDEQNEGSLIEAVKKFIENEDTFNREYLKEASKNLKRMYSKELLKKQ